MPSEDFTFPEGMGPYEKWPGYKQLVGRLNAFMTLLKRSDRAFMAVELGLISQPNHLRFHVNASANNVDLVVPKDKSEFDKSGHRVRIAFTVNNSEASDAISSNCKDILSPSRVGEVALWAHSGESNDVLAAYKSMALNPEGPRCEIVLVCLGDNRFELGFDAHGNLFDKLLLADNVIANT